MGRTVHVIGNGPSCVTYEPAKGLKLTCNVPPFEVKNHYASCIVDFKMMAAIQEGSVMPPGEWICGWRPHKWCEMNPMFYVKYAGRIKDFYKVLPPYVQNYTDFNCGHFAVHYAANKLGANEIHMYGFDSIFQFNVKSSMDVVLMSDRGNINTHRLLNNWRPIWQGIYNQFPNTQFVVHQKDDGVSPKIDMPKNVEVKYS